MVGKEFRQLQELGKMLLPSRLGAFDMLSTTPFTNLVAKCLGGTKLSTMKKTLEKIS